MFAVVDNVDQTPVFVKQGESGFWPCKVDQMGTWMQMHAAQGEAVTESALMGSMFGWEKPAAQLAVLSPVNNARAPV
jgi:hypothetical protein